MIKGDLDSDLSIDSSIDETNLNVKNKTCDVTTNQNIILDETKNASDDVVDTNISRDEKGIAEEGIKYDIEDKETTTKSGRPIKRINYKDFATYGSQYSQTGTIKVRKDDDIGMFKRVMELTMLHLSK